MESLKNDKRFMAFDFNLFLSVVLLCLQSLQYPKTTAKLVLATKAQGHGTL
jgi:hypothetical protein